MIRSTERKYAMSPIDKVLAAIARRRAQHHQAIRLEVVPTTSTRMTNPLVHHHPQSCDGYLSYDPYVAGNGMCPEGCTSIFTPSTEDERNWGSLIHFHLFVDESGGIRQWTPFVGSDNEHTQDCCVPLWELRRGPLEQPNSCY